MAERITGGPQAGAPSLRVALRAMCEQADSDPVAVGRWLKVPGFPILQESAAHQLWDEAAVRQLAEAAVRHARDSGALAGLPRALTYRAGVHLIGRRIRARQQQLIEEADVDHRGDRRKVAGALPRA